VQIQENEGSGVIVALWFALAAAFCSAVNLMTQHAASISAPQPERGWRLARYLIRHPLWLLGWAAAAGTFAFQALALHNGPMSEVQPVLVTELVFVLVLRRIWIRQQVAAAAWASALAVCLALAVFLIAAEPTGGRAVPQPGRWLSAGLVFGVTIALLTALGRVGSPRRRAAIFAAAAALAWALEATLLKAVTDTLTAFGITGMLTRWPVYALIAVGAASNLLEQAALHVGPLSVSQPILVIVNPFASIILSVWLFDERFTDNPAKITIAVLSFAALAAAVTTLTRTAPQDLSPAAPSTE
jgi:drug/metabolite transporter (DMT)-like permease